jgi:hypothetical protein
MPHMHPQEGKIKMREGMDWIQAAYSGRRITLTFSYVTERGEGKMEGARESKTVV